MRSKMQKDVDKDLRIQELAAESELKTQWISLLVHDAENLMSTFNWLSEAFENNEITEDMVLKLLPEIRQQIQVNKNNFKGTSDWVRLQLMGDIAPLSRINIQNVFFELKEELKRSLDQKQLKLEYIGDPTVCITKDKVLLHFVLKKIIENAIKYSYTKGRIVFRTNENASGIQIRIEDQGMGMNANVLASIFSLKGSPYTGTQHEKGAGLSLIIVSDFVKKLEGTLIAQSEEEKNTVFELSFPVKK